VQREKHLISRVVFIRS